MSCVGKNSRHGFTLAELVVATTLITIVMTAVYTAFGSAVRIWRTAEANQSVYQESRVALSTIEHELNCIVGGSQHLFSGKDDEVEFYAVTPPMNVEKGEGPRVLWINYRFNRSGHRLERREAIVKGPLPIMLPGDEEINRGRIKLATKYNFTMATKVRDFEITYIRLPVIILKENEPYKYVKPVEMKRTKEGWGLPQGIKISLTVEDPESPTKETTFTTQITFRIPQPLYDEEKMGLTDG